MMRRNAAGLTLLFTVTAAAVTGHPDASAQAPASQGQSGASVARKPNIVFILGDDLGYCDISMYGCKDIPTPSIDSIGTNGIRFTDAYVAAPVCSPSRAALMTGRYQQRFGFEFNAGPLQRALNNKDMGLPLTEITLAQVMKKAGYATGMVGKWHLGMNADYRPTARGFDEYFGFLFGANLYATPKTPHVTTRTATGGGGSSEGTRTAQNPIYRNTTPVEEDEYLTDAFAREAVAYIDRHQKQPFFLYAPFNAPHEPFQATQKYLDRFPNVKDERRRVYMAMVSALDDAVGAILKKLRDTGLERETLVVFLSDNGCATYTGACTNDPLRYGKLTHLEGGFRVPFAMQWPGRLEAGTVSRQVISSLDLFPTAVALAGGELPKDRVMDGVNLVPYLTGQTSGSPHDVLSWRNGSNAAVRKGHWKLFKGGDRYWLFDLSKDLGEKDNLAAERPDIVEQLKQELTKWEAQLKAPLWPCRTPGGTFEVDSTTLDICV